MADGPRTSAKLDPVLSWTVLTDSPLLGFALAREAGLLLAWDDASHVYLLDATGDRRYESRAPDRIVSAAISDDGNLVAVLLVRSRLLLLGPELEPVADRQGPPDATNVAVDPHGRFVAVGYVPNDWVPAAILSPDLKDRDTSQTKQFLPVANAPFTPIRWHSDGKHFIVGGSGHPLTIRTLDF